MSFEEGTKLFRGTERGHVAGPRFNGCTFAVYKGPNENAAYFINMFLIFNFN